MGWHCSISLYSIRRLVSGTTPTLLWRIRLATCKMSQGVFLGTSAIALGAICHTVFPEEYWRDKSLAVLNAMDRSCLKTCVEIFRLLVWGRERRLSAKRIRRSCIDGGPCGHAARLGHQVKSFAWQCHSTSPSLAPLQPFTPINPLTVSVPYAD